MAQYITVALLTLLSGGIFRRECWRGPGPGPRPDVRGIIVATAPSSRLVRAVGAESRFPGIRVEALGHVQRTGLVSRPPVTSPGTCAPRGSFARQRSSMSCNRGIVVERGAHVRTAGAAAACCAPAAAACCGPVVRQQLQRVVRLACPQRVRVRSHPVRRVAPVRCDPTHLAAWPRRSWLSGRARLSVALSGPAFPLRSPGPRRPVARAAPLCASRVGCLCGARSQARSGRSSAAAARWCPMLRVPAHCALRQRRPVPRAVPLCAVRAVAWPAPAASSRAARPPRPRGTTRAARTVPPALCVPWSGRGAMTVVRRMVALRSSPGPFPRTPIASCGAASGVCSRLFGSPELQKGEGLKKTPFRNMKHDTSPKEGKKTVST